MPWPEVFSRPLDEPYTPSRDEWLIRSSALRDMLDGLKLRRAGLEHEHYAAVMLKLGNIAGCAANARDISKCWHEMNLEKFGTPEDKRQAALLRVLRVINDTRPAPTASVEFDRGHMRARSEIFSRVEEIMEGRP